MEREGGGEKPRGKVVVQSTNNRDEITIEMMQK